jgi:hypothetical protein
MESKQNGWRDVKEDEVAKAWEFIYDTLEDEWITHLQTVKEGDLRTLWQKINAKFLQDTRNWGRKAVKQFFMLEKNQEQSVEDFISLIDRKAELINKMKILKDFKITDYLKLIVLLEGVVVTERDYEVFNPVIINLDAKSKLTWEQAVNALLPPAEREEARRAPGMNAVTNYQDGSKEDDKKSKDCRNYLRSGKCKFGDTCRFNHDHGHHMDHKAKREEAKKNVLCYVCGKRGHYARECDRKMDSAPRSTSTGSRGRGKSRSKSSKKVKKSKSKKSSSNYVRYDESDSSSDDDSTSESESESGDGGDISNMFVNNFSFFGIGDEPDISENFTEGKSGMGDSPIHLTTAAVFDREMESTPFRRKMGTENGVTEKTGSQWDFFSSKMDNWVPNFMVLLFLLTCLLYNYSTSTMYVCLELNTQLFVMFSIYILYYAAQICLSVVIVVGTYVQTFKTLITFMLKLIHSRTIICGFCTQKYVVWVFLGVIITFGTTYMTYFGVLECAVAKVWVYIEVFAPSIPPLSKHLDLFVFASIVYNCKSITSYVLKLHTHTCKRIVRCLVVLLALNSLSIVDANQFPLSGTSFALEEKVGVRPSTPKTVLDTGTNHNTFISRSVFIPSTLYEREGSMRVFDGRGVKTSYAGTAVFCSKNGGGGVTSICFPNSIYAPHGTVNLLSLGRCVQSGYKVHSTEREICLIDPVTRKIVIYSRLASDGIYYVEQVPTTARDLSMYDNTDRPNSTRPKGRSSSHKKKKPVSEIPNQSYFFEDLSELGEKCFLLSESHTGGLSAVDLAHRRLVHLNVRYIYKIDPKLKKRGEKPCFCDACVMAKSHRRPYSKDRVQTYKAGEEFSSDLCGPMPFPSYEGFLYFMLLVDSATRMTWVFFVKFKSDVGEILKLFFAYILNRKGRYPYSFRSDGGGEYVNNDFRSFLQKIGVHFTITTPYNSAQNGTVERKIRTVEEASNAIMYQADAPRFLWAEAVKYVVWVLNRVPQKSSVLHWEAPIHKWEGDRPDFNKKDVLKHARVWGCEAFVHVHDKVRKKFGYKSQRGVFVGLDSNRMGFRVYLPHVHKVVTSRDVVFNEGVFPFKKDKGLNPLYDESGNRKARDYIVFEHNPITVPAHPRGVKSEKKKDFYALPPSKAARVVGEAVKMSETGAKSFVESKKPVFVSQRPTEMSATRRGAESGDFSESKAEPAAAAEAQAQGTKKVYESGRIVRRSTRRSVKPERGTKENPFYSFSTRGADVPENRREAMESDEWPEWEKAEKKEVKLCFDRGAFDIVDAKEAEGHTVITAREVYERKLNPDGTTKKRRMRLVGRGFQEKEGKDFKWDEIFSPVAQIKSFRLLLAISVLFDWGAYHWDVSGAYLYGDIKGKLFMKFPACMEKRPGKLIRLRKSLYGLKEAGAIWFRFFRKLLLGLGFIPLLTDVCVYYHETINMMLSIHVDDAIVVTDNEVESDRILRELRKSIKVTNEGPVARYLAIRVFRGEGYVHLCQPQYVKKVLSRFGMENCKTAPTPTGSVAISHADCPSSEEEKRKVRNFPFKELVGSLLYKMICTSPEIAYAVVKLAQFSENFGTKHISWGKRIVRYLAGNMDSGIRYVRGDGKIRVDVYSDSDWGSDSGDRKSVSGYVVFLAQGPVAWRSVKQRIVAQSTCEAEFIALSEAIKELLWFLKMLKELRFEMERKPRIFVDNQSAIALTKNPVAHNRTKHIDIRYFFIRHHIENGEFDIIYVPSGKNIADIFTKCVSQQIFARHLKKLISKK